MNKQNENNINKKSKTKQKLITVIGLSVFFITAILIPSVTIKICKEPANNMQIKLCQTMNK